MFLGKPKGEVGGLVLLPGVIGEKLKNRCNRKGTGYGKVPRIMLSRAMIWTRTLAVPVFS